MLNPSTLTFFEVPNPNSDQLCGDCITNSNYGFGFDSRNNDFKVVRISRRSETRVCSLKANSWRLVGELFPALQFGDFNGVLIDNHLLLHWTIWLEPERQLRILCFGLCNEQWHGLSIPDFVVRGSLDSTSDFASFLHLLVKDMVHLGNLEGCLCLLIRIYVRGCESGDVWVMKESWVKLLDISDSCVIWVCLVRSLFISLFSF